MSRLTSVLSICIFLAIVGTSCINDGEPDNSGGVNVGSKLPDFTVKLNNGEFLSTADFTDRRGAIILFNTSCSDCQRELPGLQNVYDKTKEDIIWVAIAREENEESISKFWSQKSLSIPYSPQPDRKIYNLFATSGIPRLYLTDGNKVTHCFDPEDILSIETLYQIILNE